MRRRFASFAEARWLIPCALGVIAAALFVACTLNPQPLPPVGANSTRSDAGATPSDGLGGQTAASSDAGAEAPAVNGDASDGDVGDAGDGSSDGGDAAADDGGDDAGDAGSN